VLAEAASVAPRRTRNVAIEHDLGAIGDTTGWPRRTPEVTAPDTDRILVAPRPPPIRISSDPGQRAPVERFAT
jgi:hypothetical protein